MKISEFKNNFKSLPIAFTGLALGIGGLGNCYRQLFSLNNQSQVGNWVSSAFFPFLILFVLMILFKYIFHFHELKKDLHNPLTISLMPTFSMCLMLLAGFIGMWDTNITSPCQISAATLMVLAIAIQFILLFYFGKSIFYNHIKNSEVVYGSYFVPTVGLITSCTVSGNIPAIPNIFFQVIWYLGYFMFLVSLPVITYLLLFKIDKLNKEHYPTIAVWFSPANLSCAGFYQVFILAANKQVDLYPQTFLNVIAILTTMLGFVTTVLLYFFIFRIFIHRFNHNLKGFSPILCSLSFPCAIGVTSMIFTAKAIGKINADLNSVFLNDMQSTFGVVSIIFCAITSVIILYLLINMLIFAWKSLFKQKSN